MCTFCGPCVNEAAAQTSREDLRKMTHEQRAEKRAERLAEFEKYIDSVVLSHNFEFNPQTVQQMPAGSMKFLTNPVYTVTLWRGSLDVCLPYYVGYVPPYHYVLLNTGMPSVSDFVTKQTEDLSLCLDRVYLHVRDKLSPRQRDAYHIQYVV